MNQPHQKPAPAEEQALRISLEGPPAFVRQCLAGIHAALNGQQTAPQEPAQLFMSSAQAASFTGLSTDRLAALIKAGKLHNHGKGRSLVFSRADLLALAERGE